MGPTFLKKVLVPVQERMIVFIDLRVNDLSYEYRVISGIACIDYPAVEIPGCVREYGGACLECFIFNAFELVGLPAGLEPEMLSHGYLFVRKHVHGKDTAIFDKVMTVPGLADGDGQH